MLLCMISSMAKYYQTTHFRHHVKPGITGWAQVDGFRGETPRIEQMQRRVELDLWYINNWSLLLDLKILFKTAFEVAGARNAY